MSAVVWLLLSFALSVPGAGARSVSRALLPSAGAQVWTNFHAWARAGTTLDAAGAAELCPPRSGTAAGAGAGHPRNCRHGPRAGVDPYPARGFHGHNYYNGGRFLYGTLTSPVVPTAVPFSQAVASWDALTPTGTWIDVRIRVDIGNQWTRWYVMGIWALHSDTISRHSADAQGDTGTTSPSVDTDTLDLTAGHTAAHAVQVRVTLFAALGSTCAAPCTGAANTVTPTLRLAAVTTSTAPGTPRRLSHGTRTLWGHALPVPLISQRPYSTGDDWCSPTSVAMVIAYWAQREHRAELLPAAQVPRVAAGVDDWRYGGTGNWPFNTAYAGALGLEAYVARLSGMAAIERWIARGVPVIISIAWGRGHLNGAPWPLSSGHLLVVVGFDTRGNPLVNDPGGIGPSVRRTYQRAQLERDWLAASAGTAYIIQPWPTSPEP